MTCLCNISVKTGVPRIQETVKRTKESMPDSMMSRADTKTVPWHRSTGQLYDEQEPSARSSPLHRSTDQLNENQCSLGRVPPFYLSTGVTRSLISLFTSKHLKQQFLSFISPVFHVQIG